MHIFLHKSKNYGHVTRFAYACSHICLRSSSWNSSRSRLTCSLNTTQTRLCWTVNIFAKSQLFANINVFKLFDLPKSCLNDDRLWPLPRLVLLLVVNTARATRLFTSSAGRHFVSSGRWCSSCTVVYRHFQRIMMSRYCKWYWFIAAYVFRIYC